MKSIIKLTGPALAIAAVLIFGSGTKSALAQESPGVLYVPLIGISSVPQPLSLPLGPGIVTYHYAVKNFLRQAPLTGISVTDDKCSQVKFVEGDDNHDSKLDFTETWRYTCTVKLTQITHSIATAAGTANNLPASQEAYATVAVGSDIVPPLVNITNVTKVAYPLTLSAGGSDVTFMYRVNNPGLVPLSQVSVTGDKCGDMSGKLGDTNGNNLLDMSEVWVYSCTAHIIQTTANTVAVVAFGNGMKAVGYATMTVTASAPAGPAPSNLFDLAISPVTASNPDIKILVWVVLSVILAVLLAVFLITTKGKSSKAQ